MKLTPDDLKKLKKTPSNQPPREILPYLELLDKNTKAINEALELGNFDIANMLLKDNQETIEQYKLWQYLTDFCTCTGFITSIRYEHNKNFYCRRCNGLISCMCCLDRPATYEASGVYYCEFCH